MIGHKGSTAWRGRAKLWRFEHVLGLVELEQRPLQRRLHARRQLVAQQHMEPDAVGIADLDEGQADQASVLEVEVESSGRFTILNPRTNFSKMYTSR